MLSGTLTPTAAETVVPKEWLPVLHISRAILHYQAKCDHLPFGTNKEIVAELVRSECLHSNVGEFFDSEGRILDWKGRPLVFFHSTEAGMVIATVDPETGTMKDYLFLENRMPSRGLSDARSEARRRIAEQTEENRKDTSQKTAQPGATDNPDDAQRLREDH